MTTATQFLPVGSMSLFVFSHLSARRSSSVKFLSVIEVDCIVEAILLLMLSLAGCNRSSLQARSQGWEQGLGKGMGEDGKSIFSEVSPESSICSCMSWHH